MDENIYYVYGFYDGNGIPFYIGRGKNNRILQHFRKSVIKERSQILFYNKLSKMIDNNELIETKKLVENISLQESKVIEQVFIELIGRRDLNTGTLCNLTDGGEGHCGYVKSEELKQRISGWSKGRKISDEQKEILRMCNTGKKLSDKTKAKISSYNLGKLRGPNTEQHNNNISRGKKKFYKNIENRIKARDIQRRKNEIPIVQCIGDVPIKIWKNQYLAAEFVGESKPSRLIECCKSKKNKFGLYKRCKNYNWKYI